MAAVEYIDPSPRGDRGPRRNVILLDSFRNPSRIRTFAESLGVSYPIAAVLLANKSFDSSSLEELAAAFADTGFPRHPMEGYPDTLRTLERLRSLPKDSRIGIYGDYDGDGVTSVLIVRQALLDAGFSDLVVEFSRVSEEGFGLSEAGSRTLFEDGCVAVLVLDTGTNSTESLSWLAERGVAVTVIDHHPLTDGKSLVEGVDYVNPHLHPGLTPRPTELRNAGLSWYFALALAEGEPSPFLYGESLALAALGTVADAGNQMEGPHNRWLLQQGLRGECLRSVPYLEKLFGVSPDSLAFDISDGRVAEGFRKLSLGKRSKSFRPDTVFTLLAPDTDEPGRAAALAEVEEHYGRFMAHAEAGAAWLAENDGGQAITVAVIPAEVVPAEFIGISGTLASKASYRTGKPAFIFIRDDDGTLKGSWRMARTGADGEALVRGVDQENPGVVARYGGHAAAGGVLLAGLPSLDVFEFLLLGAWASRPTGGTGGKRPWTGKKDPDVVETFVTCVWDPESDGLDLSAAMLFAPFSRYSVKRPSFLVKDLVAEELHPGVSGKREVVFSHGNCRLRCVLANEGDTPLLGSTVDAVVTLTSGSRGLVLRADMVLPSEYRIGSFG